ncbi:O-succinylbenzoate synthase [Enemella evansiae]|uniref:o-succinylbenzoate synthase n=1 Tax=Enemella evansiae TaxID=2016499 RepID=A0A255GSF2_9ACTN|nr:o-succinylbenzoate synthase [Enemella evansiae]OYO09322.1 O-succinylbenzoate synthase [Enemella evansiae]OYO15944.1 O-succinylbenzoate synthase [Enemella evansiae]
MPELHVYDIAMRTRFRGITRRQGMVWRGAGGWAEWSPFLDYHGDELKPWLAAAREAADDGYPEPVRESVPVNATVPAVGPEQAYAVARDSGCRTAKVKVAEPGQTLADDLARVEAVRDALGVDGRVRVDANGGWDLDQAVAALRELGRFGLEYAEQPVASVEDLARLRRTLLQKGISVPIAADESIRRSGDPERVAELAAADVAVLKVQPLGGVRRCLELAELLGLPVVVSSALETSIGLAAGVALAAALPELPHACGLNTRSLLTDDLVADSLTAVDGAISVRAVEADPDALRRCAADEETVARWETRLAGVPL